MKVSTALPSDAVATRSTDLQQGQPRERILIAIDHSGSMDGTFGHRGRRLDAAKDAIQSIVGMSSRAVSEIGLMAFDHDAELLAKPSTNFSAVLGQALSIGVGGGTSFRVMFELVFQQEPQRCILLSDGEPQEPRDMLFACANQAKSLGIRFDTVGIGEADETLMRGIAERTDGIYTRCENVEQLVKTFRQLETRARALLEAK